MSLRETLESGAEQGHEESIEILQDVPATPPGGGVLLGWFWELRKAARNGMGLGAISYTEIQAWGELTATFPTPREVKILRQLDEAFVEAVASKDEKDSSSKEEGSSG